MKHYRPHILVVIALAVVLSSGWHTALRNGLIDLRFASAARQASAEVVVVAIDASSIEKIGVWPWPRRLHADLLRQLENAGVKDVVFDVDFSSPSDPASDKLFAEALESAAGSVVLPSFEQPGTDRGNGAEIRVNAPLKQFGDHSWSAVVNVAIEPDGLVRRYPFGKQLNGQFLPSMGAVLAGQYTAQRVPFLIDFSIRTASIPKVSYVDVLRGDGAALAKLKDKKVIIGATALELGDRFSVPNGGIVSGPLLQALAAESIIQNRALRSTSDIVTLAGLCLISLMMMLAWRRLGAGKRVILLVAMAAAVEAIAILLQSKLPLVLDTSLFHTAIVVYLGAIALDEIDFRDLLGRIAENRFQRIAMSLGDGLVCLDSSFLVTVWNPGAVAIFGYQPEEMIGKPFDTIRATGDNVGSDSFSVRHAIHPRLHQAGGMVMEFEGRRKSGEVFPVEACFSGWQGTDGIQYGAIMRDISVRKREAERIRHLAEYDSLTGLANRYTLHSILKVMVSIAKAEHRELALVVLGIEGFQQINGMLGHAYGDSVVCAVTQRLKAEIGQAGIVARLSGDEFAVAIPGAGMTEAAAKFCERIRLAFEAPVLAGTRTHRVRLDAGVAVYPTGGETADELLSNGHLAFCRAKATRRAGHVLFESSIRQELETRLDLETELERAVELNEFELFYQPQVRLADDGLIGAEALIRWHHPTRGLLSPGEFMPIVNTSAISERVAEWVLASACRQARNWEQAGHRIRVGINLSPSQLQSGDLAVSVREILDVTGVTPSLIELEVTEDILLLNDEKVLDTFRTIREMGVLIVFDDFGTGYGSLSYLKKFPLDGLKIDRSFVLGLSGDSNDAAIVNSTISLGRQLGLGVIAEGIEDRATADLLARMGCEEGQGYFFGRPMPASAFEAQFLTQKDSASQFGAGKAA